MKTYQKPVLVALSLNANDRLCGECHDNGANILLYQNPTGSFAQYLDLLVGNSFDGVLTREELDNLFGPGEGCSTLADNYCKFTSTGLTVAWS